MNLSSFLKKLYIFDVIFGARSRKLTGVCDKDNKLLDTVTFTAPATISLTVQVPDFFREDTYFRVTGSVGANNQKLFRVSQTSGSTITVDPAAPGVDAMTTTGAESLSLDARLAIVHDDPLISKLNSEGNTVYNVANGNLTTGLDDCDLATVLAEHYHESAAGGTPGEFCQPFVIGDWFSSDIGDLYSIDVNHGLGTLFPGIRVFDNSSPDETITFGKVRILDSNTVRVSVAQEAVDCRFIGNVCIIK